MKYFSLGLLLILSTVLTSQEIDSLTEIDINNKQQIIENFLRDENFDKNDDIINDYSYDISNKLNLNSCTKEELLRLNILDIFQINNFLNYRKNNNEIYSFYELNSIHGIEREDVEKLMNYAHILPSSEEKFKFKDIDRYISRGKHQFLIRGQSVLEEQKAYEANSEIYNGNRLRIYHNYRFNYKKLLRFGYTLEKDPGESLNFSRENIQGFDFASAYLELSKVFIFDKLIIGDFKIEFGQGLNSWTSYSPSKSSSNLIRLRFSRGGMGYTGSNENNYLRGVFNKISINNISISTYASNKKVDARYIEENDSYKLLTTGLHRTISEINNKNTISKMDYGFRIDYKSGISKIGLNITSTAFSKKISDGEDLYQSDFETSNNFLNTSLDYMFKLDNIIFSGELAFDKRMNLAMIANALYSYHNLSLFLSYRNYDKNYSSVNWNPFSEYSKFNEEAFFIGVESELHKYLSLKAHLDIFKNNWFQYQKSFPERGYEYQLELRSNIASGSKLIVLFKHQQKQIKAYSSTREENLIKKQTRTSYRISFATQLNEILSMQTLFENLELLSNEKEKSYLAYQEFILHLRRINSRISLRATTFNTPGWDSRIYTYERDLLYSLSFPVFYDKGNSFYLLINKNFGKHISSWLKFSQRIFDYKNRISSGPEEITGNTKTEIKLQIRIKL